RRRFLACRCSFLGRRLPARRVLGALRRGLARPLERLGGLARPGLDRGEGLLDGAVDRRAEAQNDRCFRHRSPSAMETPNAVSEYRMIVLLVWSRVSLPRT